MTKRDLYRYILMFLGSLIVLISGLAPLFYYYAGVIIGGICYIVWPTERKE